MTKLTPPSQILNKAFVLFESRYKVLLPFIAVAIIVLALSGIVTNSPVDPVEATFKQAVGIGAVGFVMFLVNIFFFMIAILVYTSDESHWRVILGKGIKLLPRYIVLMILQGIIIVGGYFLLIVPGFIFTIWFSFASYIYLHERHRGLHALMASRHLVKGYFWQIIGRLLYLVLIGIMLIVPFIVIQIFFQNNIVITLQQFWMYIFVLPLMFAYTLELCEELKSIQPEFSYQRRPAIRILLIGLAGLILVPAIFFGIILYTFRNLFM